MPFALQPQVVQERVMVSEGVQQMYEQPPQQSMQQQSMQQQSYQQPAYQQQQQQQGDLRQQQGDLRQQQQQSPQRSLSGPAVIDTTDLRAFLMRCAAPPPRCTPVVNLAGGAGAPSTTAPRSMSTRAPAPPCLPPPLSPAPSGGWLGL